MLRFEGEAVGPMLELILLHCLGLVLVVWARRGIRSHWLFFAPKKNNGVKNQNTKFFASGCYYLASEDSIGELKRVNFRKRNSSKISFFAIIASWGKPNECLENIRTTIEKLMMRTESKCSFPSGSFGRERKQVSKRRPSGWEDRGEHGFREDRHLFRARKLFDSENLN